MRRLIDLVVLAIFVATVVVTIQSFRRPEPTEPPPPAEPVVEEAPPATAAIEAPTPRSEVVMIGGGPTEITDSRRDPPFDDEDDDDSGDREVSGLVSAVEGRGSNRSGGSNGGQRRPTSPTRTYSSSPGYEGDRTSPSSSRYSSGGASEADAKRAAARSRLQSTYRSIGSQAQRLIRDAQDYVRTCGNDTQGYCGVSLQRIGQQAVDIGRELRDAQELARTSWLNPGEVREMREQNGLDDTVFDRLISLVNKYGR
jgi:hypothetical protein